MSALSCWVKSTFGVNCPGCGFQTALSLFLKGEIIQSIETYPGLIPFMLFLLLIAGRVLEIKKISPRLLKIMGFACLIIILVSYLLRLIMD